MQAVDEKWNLPLANLIERKLIHPGPPRVTGRNRVEVFAEMLVEDDRFGSQAVEIRRFDPVVAATAQIACVEVVEADDDGAARSIRNLKVGFQDSLPRMQ
jgi:hypothetical protein